MKEEKYQKYFCTVYIRKLFFLNALGLEVFEDGPNVGLKAVTFGGLIWGAEGHRRSEFLGYMLLHEPLSYP